MNRYDIILLQNEKNHCIGSIYGYDHEIYRNCLCVIEPNESRARASFKYVTKIIIQPETMLKNIEKIIKVYTYLPQEYSNFVVNKNCTCCEMVTQHNIYLKDENTVGYYECTECGDTINSDIIVEILEK